MKRKILLLLTFINALGFANAQQGTGQTTSQVQPKIMVFPWVKDEEDRKTIFDANSNIRVAIAKINEAFEKRGANLANFDALLRELKENAALNKSSANQEDFKTMVLASSAADIYVSAEVLVVNHTARSAKSVTVILEAYQAGTANSMASKTAAGPMFQTDDVGFLTMKAIDTVSTDFLNTIQLKFNDIRANGQSVYMEFSLDANSKYTFDSEIGTDEKFLSQVVKDWVKKNSVKSVYNYQGVTGKKMIISDVRLPLRDPKEPDEPYNGDNIFRDIYKYLKAQGIQTRREISSNNKILITIL